jgi:hypothetical protein
LPEPLDRVPTELAELVEEQHPGMGQEREMYLEALRVPKSLT